MLIAAEGAVRYGPVIDVLDLCRKMRLREVRFAKLRETGGAADGADDPQTDPADAPATGEAPLAQDPTSPPKRLVIRIDKDNRLWIAGRQQTLASLRQKDPGLSVVMFTAYGFDDNLVYKTRQLGASGFISKHLPLTQIISTFADSII